MKKIFSSILHPLYVVYAFLMFFILLLFVFIAVAAVSFLPDPKSGNAIYKICHAWAAIWYFLIGIRHEEIYEVPQNREQPYIFVLNHQSYMDIPAAVYCIRQPVRILGKIELAKIPIFGYVYRKAGILVDRKNTANKKRSVEQMKKAVSHHLSVLVYPEGTFNETGEPLKFFYNGAFRLAIDMQVNIKPVILPDTLDRMHYSSVWTLHPGRCRTVFLPEISVQGLALNDVEMLKNKVYHAMEAALIKYRAL